MLSRTSRLTPPPPKTQIVVFLSVCLEARQNRLVDTPLGGDHLASTKVTWILEPRSSDRKLNSNPPTIAVSRLLVCDDRMPTPQNDDRISMKTPSLINQVLNWTVSFVQWELFDLFTGRFLIQRPLEANRSVWASQVTATGSWEVSTTGHQSRCFPEKGAALFGWVSQNRDGHKTGWDFASVGSKRRNPQKLARPGLGSCRVHAGLAKKGCAAVTCPGAEICMLQWRSFHHDHQCCTPSMFSVIRLTLAMETFCKGGVALLSGKYSRSWGA